MTSSERYSVYLNGQMSIESEIRNVLDKLPRGPKAEYLRGLVIAGYRASLQGSPITRFGSQELVMAGAEDGGPGRSVAELRGAPADRAMPQTLAPVEHGEEPAVNETSGEPFAGLREFLAFDGDE